MNIVLQNQIVEHIFQCFGIFAGASKLNTCKSILDKKFELEKRMCFEEDDGTVSEHEIYSACGGIDKSSVNLLIINLSEKNEQEYIMFFRMDNLPIYVLEARKNTDEFETAFSIVMDDKYVPATIALQASFLSGTENMFDIFIDWKRQDKYDDLYAIASRYFK